MRIKPKSDRLYPFGQTAIQERDLVEHPPRRLRGFVPSATCNSRKVGASRDECLDKVRHRVGWLQTISGGDGQPFSPIARRPDLFGNSHAKLFVRLRLRSPLGPRVVLQRSLLNIGVVPARFGRSDVASSGCSNLFRGDANVRRFGFGRHRVRRLRIVVVWFGVKPRGISSAQVANEAGNRYHRNTFSDEIVVSQSLELTVRIRPPPAISPGATVV